jgi:hypothetical protein
MINYTISRNVGEYTYIEKNSKQKLTNVVYIKLDNEHNIILINNMLPLDNIGFTNDNFNTIILIANYYYMNFI